MTVTIGIKAYNEERHIAACLTSAVAAARQVGGVMVLADAGSGDRTVAIARGFPVRIVQLADARRRSCGASAQLAFLHAEGEYFYLLDGDMVMHRDFLPAAIAFLDANPEVAGVGGRVREVNTDNQEFQIRALAVEADRNWRPGIVDRLDCGGLYRVSAIREVGYFADSNLHAFEEFELAARLRSRGWKLARIDLPAVDHYGHRTEGYRLLWRRLASGYARAPGEVLRAAIGQRHLPIVLRRLGHIRHGLCVILWWAALLLTLAAPLSPPVRMGLLLLLVLGPWLGLSWRRRSLWLGLYSMAAWNVTAVGLLLGLLWPRRPATAPLPATSLTG
ncbi:glycosyltransferase [Neoroseomonas oryzicola]|uniref:Glycosyltransferase n=1 Tax=Neoroseomonas oryzicola TaxID=535904 RepID=A0A9X9WP69_9PROT|nr:glycosyltransferase [Neoroseomonas oryzicola]MBR0662129.1 glycosyltransferase [Neoroseomonas oryzicola]NKE20246.1 glycosyltransferase [Neoroseomonas oryzicola]